MLAKVLSICALVVFISSQTTAQDARAQYPKFLSNSYFNINIGYFNYPFSSEQLEPSYSVGVIEVPHIGVRVVLLGHQINQYLSAQVSYMRPVKYVKYKNINGDKTDHFVWMHFGSLTAKAQLPLNNKLSVFGEAGLGILSRSGFEVNNQPVVRDASYGTLIAGGGLQFKLNNKWDFLLSANYIPGKEKFRQPHTVYYSVGFKYNMRPLPAERVATNASGGYIFPKNILQVGYSTNHFGYRVNNFVSKKVPIFWGGSVEIERGTWMRYTRNVYHTRKVFALDVGTSFGWWRSKKNKNEFFTLSVFPQFKFNLLRTKPFDLYLNYSLAGPSYISERIVDDLNTGRHFTFQDFMGMGIFTGKKRNINAEININHYSNGNIFTENAGVKIPLTFNLGYSF